MKQSTNIIKGVVIIAVALIIIACGLYFYARYGEPNRLEITRVSVESPLVQGRIKIAAFADVHIGSGGMGSARLGKVLAAIQAEKPDIVVFLGDFYDNYAKYSGGEEQRLASLLALPGLEGCLKFAVLGNHDMSQKAKKAFITLFQAAGWQVLVNSAVQSLGINIIGSDDVIFGAPDVAGLVCEDMFNLLLVHEPDFGRDITGVGLQLSGHTHGGQVRVPFVGPLVLPKWGREYVRGMHTKPDGGQIYVNRGLGMSTLPFRFAAVPELTIITIQGAGA